MAKYFTSVYKNYYDKIDLNKKVDTYCNLLSEKITMLKSSFNTCVSKIESSNWHEEGKSELLSNYENHFNKKIESIKNNNESLINVVNIVKNDLFPMLSELKEKDTLYCDTQSIIKSYNYDSSTITAKKKELTSLETELVALVKKIDKKIIEIKQLNDSSYVAKKTDDSVYTATATVPSTIDNYDYLGDYLKLKKKSNKEFIDKLKMEVLENKMKDNNIDYSSVSSKYSTTDNTQTSNNTIKLSLLGCNWNVVDTKIDVTKYTSLAYNKGIRQNSNEAKYGGYCLAFSYVHASNLYNGSTSDNAESAYSWQHSSEFNNFFSDSKQETLEVIYNEVMEGKPVVMQVNGNTSGTSRHFVTVVGIKDSVTSAKNIKEDDLLILDSWDCKLERMDTESSRFMTTGKETGKSYSGYYLRLLK